MKKNLVAQIDAIQKKHHVLVVVIHNVRSAHNVGSIIRSCDGAGVSLVICTGYTPNPNTADPRHRRAKEEIIKTALGAQESVPIYHYPRINHILKILRCKGFTLVALEQTKQSVSYTVYRPVFPLALIVGNEVRGVDTRIVRRCDAVVDIPMCGTKESLNVSVATAIVVYRFLETKIHT